jgi:hypothetical protein
LTRISLRSSGLRAGSSLSRGRADERALYDLSASRQHNGLGPIGYDHA